MKEDNLLDDFNLEEASTGELATVAGSLSKWLRPVSVLSFIIGVVYIISGIAFLVDDSKLETIIYGLIVIGIGALWCNAARWQLKFIQWTRRFSLYDTAYDQEHWIYLNYELWRWLAFSVIGNIVGAILMGI
ncbi:MAG: hypothetical protein ACRBFS_12605 [Aureispira sp.]